MDVNPVYVSGVGAVSPAGWGVASLREALRRGVTIAQQDVLRPGWERPLRARAVPASDRIPCLQHARLRRCSPITQYTVAAALETVGKNPPPNDWRIGVILCVFSGCVIYSRRFFQETLNDPQTASPLLFPETVFNAPASHLAAVLRANAWNYTLVGDQSMFLQALLIARDWLGAGVVEGCIVVGGEEIDWLTADAFHPLDPALFLSEGAGALYLTPQPLSDPPVALSFITSAVTYGPAASPAKAAAQVKHEIASRMSGDQILFNSLHGLNRLHRAEEKVWADWTGKQCSVKCVLGEGLAASGAWQCVAAADAVHQGAAPGAFVNIVGTNQAAIAAEFSLG